MISQCPELIVTVVYLLSRLLHPLKLKLRVSAEMLPFGPHNYGINIYVAEAISL